MPYSLKSRNVLVVAGSRGLGALVAKKFAAEGSNVAINYVSSKESAEAAAKECASYGVKTAVFQGDGGVIADCERIVDETIKEFGGLDIIIGNAVSFEEELSLRPEYWLCGFINGMGFQRIHFLEFLYKTGVSIPSILNTICIPLHEHYIH
jgi:NAD(P)-dependent dehydrogenase (short-subunit alcohol dehydrogenase family)